MRSIYKMRGYETNRSTNHTLCTKGYYILNRSEVRKKSFLYVVTAAVLMLTGLLCSMPSIAHADTVEQVGDFTVTVADGTSANYSFDDATGTLSITSGTLTVTNTDPSTPTTNRIHITGSSEVTFAGLNLIDNGGHPVQVDDAAGTQVIIRLANSNTIAASGYETSGIYKGGGESTLKITSAAGDGSDDGKITITCGGIHAACIGAAGTRASMSNLEIAGGTYYLSLPHDSDHRLSVLIGGSDWGSSSNSTISGGHLIVDGRQSIFGYSNSSNCTMTGGILQMSQDCNFEGAIQTGIVSEDGGITYSAHGDTALEFPFEVPKDSSLDIPRNSSLTIGENGSLINNGTIYATGSVDGSISNDGVIYDEGGLNQDNVTGSGEIRTNYVEVNSGSGSGTYDQGASVEISADEPADGMAFVKWEVVHGNVTLEDETSSNTSFAMPEGCVVLRPVYAPIIAKVTSTNGEQRYIVDSGEYSITINTNPGDLIEIVPQDENDLPALEIYPFESVTLDLAGETVEFEHYINPYINPRGTSRIQNGTIYGGAFSDIAINGELTLENLTCIDLDHWYVDPTATLVVSNNVTFPNGAWFSGGGTIKTACTDAGNYGNSVTVEKQHIWNEGEFEKGQVVYTCTACSDTRTEGDNLVLGNVDIEFGNVDLTYDGAEITASDLGLNAKRGETDASNEIAFSYTPILSDGSFDEKMDGLPSEAGTYRITASLPTTISGGTAYIHESASCDITISPKPVEVSVSGLSAANKTYDGTTDVKVDTSNINLSLSGVLPQDNDSVKLTYDTVVGQFSDASAGENKPVQLTLEGAKLSNSNYTFSGTAQTDATATITPREVGLIWNNTENRVSGDDLSVTAELTNTVAGDDVYAVVSGGDATAAGTHTASATIAGSDAGNYVFSADISTNVSYSIVSAAGIEGEDSSQPNSSGPNESSKLESGDNSSQQTTPTTSDSNGLIPIALLIIGGCAAVIIGICLRHRN